MFDSSRLRRSATELDGFVRHLDVEVVAIADAQAAVGVLAVMVRQANAALSLLGARVADAAQDDEQARRWMAGATRESEREATERLEAGQAGRRHAATGEQLRKGELSTGTASDIGKAADADPSAEQKLLDEAKDTPAEDVRRKAKQKKRRACKESEADRERRRHRERKLTSWEDDDGGISGRFSTTTRQWAPIHGTLETYREAAFRRAKRRSADDTQATAKTGSGYAMDGLELMAHVAAGGTPADLGYIDADLPAALRKRLNANANGAGGKSCGGSATGKRSGGSATGMGLGKLIVRIDAAALKRGWAEGDEICDIPGVGPVSVAAVRDLLPEAFCSVVFTDAHDVAAVAHLGRRPDAFQTTALQWRHPTCTTKGCRHTARIQADHDDDWAATHYTWLPGLNGACDQCHAKKTHHGWAWIGETDTDGKRTFVAPDDPRHPSHTGQAPATPPRVEPKPRQRRPTTTGTTTGTGTGDRPPGGPPGSGPSSTDPPGPPHHDDTAAAADQLTLIA